MYTTPTQSSPALQTSAHARTLPPQLYKSKAVGGYHRERKKTPKIISIKPFPGALIGQRRIYRYLPSALFPFYSKTKQNTGRNIVAGSMRRGIEQENDNAAEG
jgi:hypothetical protein